MKKISNPPNPYDSKSREWLEPSPEARLEIYEDSSRSILSRNDSPDVGFTWSANPYRGCFHSCAYCYARRYHEYLGFGAGTDFESKLVIKPRAAELLRKEFLKNSWKGETVVFSGGTDCYQPIEAVYELTRKCLEVCLDFRNPASIITKSLLVVRDIDLLSELNRQSFCTAVVSIPFASDEAGRTIEPQASSVTRRFEAVRQLAKAGIPVGVSLAPTIPGLNDQDIPKILKKARDLGARFAFHSLVRLSGSVGAVFREKITASLPPERVERILKRLSESRNGAMNDTRFGHRMTGKGTYWEAISDLFKLTSKKLGFEDFPEAPSPSPFKAPSPQLEMGF